MSIIFIDYNYLFNKCFIRTIKQQRIKYNNKQLYNNLILLNKYNLLIDSILSITEYMEQYINDIKKTHKNINEIYFITTNNDIYTKLPSKYNTGYYIRAYKRFGTVEDLKESNLYTTKLLFECLNKTQKATTKRKKHFRDNIKNNVKGIVKEYADEYIKEYPEKWEKYEPIAANKTSKLSHYIKDFKLNLFMIQNHLTKEEALTVYNYILNNSKIKITDEIINNNNNYILSNLIFNKGNNCKYLAIKQKDNTIYNTHNKLKGVVIKQTKPQKTTLKKIIEEMNSNIIDIDNNNNINIFSENTQKFLYQKEHSETILKDYNVLQNYKYVAYVDKNNYLKYIDKVLKNFNYENFNLI